MASHQEEWLIVDGYNVLGIKKDLDDQHINLEEERNQLIHDLSEYQSLTTRKVYLVFDAHRTDQPRVVQKIEGIKVIFTGKDELADEWIESFVRSNQNSSRTLFVATSDYLEQRLILGHGAYRISSRELMSELAMIQKKMRKQLENQSKIEKGTLRERLSTEIRKKLEKWRRGK